MAELPPELGPMPGPDAFGQASSDQRFAPRTITMEDAIARQLDRIAFLRSTGQEWSEAVYQLRDMVVGLEDDEFWDGIPEDLRRGLDKKPRRQQEAIRKDCAVNGWDGYPVRAYRTGGGGVIFMPTSDQLSLALRIVMRLLARRGLAWRMRRTSKLEKYGGGEEEKPKNGVVQSLPVEILSAPDDDVVTGSSEAVPGED